MYVQYVQCPGTAPAPVARFKRLFLLAELVCGCFLVFFIIGFNNTSFFLTSHIDDIHLINRNHPNDTSTIRTKGCRIPFMRSVEPSFKHLIEYPKSLKNCETKPLVASNKSHIWIKKENLHFYNVSDEDNFTCCYKSFVRPVQVDDITSSSIDNRVKYGDCKNFSDVIKVTDEFVRILCSRDQKTIFDTFLLFVIEKKLHSRKKKAILPYNILMLGIDAVSRLNLHRTMPKTVDYLKKLGAIELLGYNKVADNTFPNLIPMLLGRTAAELRETCTPNHRSSFDNCPFVWEWFRQVGFATALAEDTASLGTFNYNLNGFKDTPTDYYIHTFMHEAEHQAGNNKPLNCNLCMNDKYFYQILLNYVDDLTTTLNSKLFGFFWETTMSHDFLNYPMVMDQSYVEVLNKWHLSGYLNETILFLLSDHGLRWGEFRSTKQGYLEERLPFVFTLLPPSFRANYSKAYHNLIQNSQRLTTPFDMHATLMDLVNLDEITNERIIARSKGYSKNRSISLFLPIPESRTCKSAEIDDHWCTCHRIIKSSTKSAEARMAAEYLVSHMNSLVEEYPQCANLTVGELLNVTTMVSGNAGDEMEWPELTIVLRAKPSGGVFEATLGKGSGKWVLAGSISRLNLYGDQSRCVSDNKLKLYCYCNAPDLT